MTLSTLSVEQKIPQGTKHRYNISEDSCSTSSSSSQLQEYNIPDVLINSPNRNTQSKVSSPSVTLRYLQWGLKGKIHNCAYGSGTFCSISLPIGPTETGHEISRVFIFCQKYRRRQILPNSHQERRQAPSSIKLTAQPYGTSIMLKLS